jgi:hypothetical protein
MDFISSTKNREGGMDPKFGQKIFLEELVLVLDCEGHHENNENTGMNFKEYVPFN